MNNRKKRFFRIGGAVVFLLYLLALVYVLFFSEGYGRVVVEERSFRYNLHPFAEISRFWNYRELLGTEAMVVNVFGNVLAFVPFGLFLPLLFVGMRRGCRVVAAGFLFSLMVESIQLVTRVGTFDVDDLILNTAGVLAGYLLFLLANRIRRTIYGKKI